MRGLALFLLLLSLLPGPPARADDTFKPLPQAMRQSKYAANCGGDFQDIVPDMPPVDDQMQSPWCATFTAKALLEHFYHRPPVNTSNTRRFSSFDLNSLSNFASRESRGRIPDFAGDLQPNPMNFLEAMQTSGAVHLEEDLPFDQAYFDKDGVIQRLSQYYENNRPLLFYEDGFQCRDQSAPSIGLERQFTELATTLAASDTREKFMAALGRTRVLYPLPRAGSARVELKPPFNYRAIMPRTGDQYVEELQKNLTARRPTAVSVCANQLQQLPGLGENLVPLTESEKRNCGPHAVVVVGMRKVGNDCQVLIRNSWGTNWPNAAGGGHAWIKLNQLLAVSAKGHMNSISERAAGTPAQNRRDFDDGAYYVGETHRLQPNGKGVLKAEKKTMEGKFENGQLVEGKLHDQQGNLFVGKFVEGQFTEGKMKTKLQDGAVYEGDYKNLQITGQGKLTKADGSVSQGRFLNGQFMEGTYNGFFTNGSRYAGGFRNGMATGQGKQTFPNGDFREGTFENGRFMSGRFKGVIDEARGLYYDGQIVNGSTTQPDRFFDKDGNPWRGN